MAHNVWSNAVLVNCNHFKLEVYFLCPNSTPADSPCDASLLMSVHTVRVKPWKRRFTRWCAGAKCIHPRALSTECILNALSIQLCARWSGMRKIKYTLVFNVIIPFTHTSNKHLLSHLANTVYLVVSKEETWTYKQQSQKGRWTGVFNTRFMLKSHTGLQIYTVYTCTYVKNDINR